MDPKLIILKQKQTSAPTEQTEGEVLHTLHQLQRGCWWHGLAAGIHPTDSVAAGVHSTVWEYPLHSMDI